MRRLVLVGGLLAMADAGLVGVRDLPEGAGPYVAPAMERVVPGRVERVGSEASWVAVILGRPLFEVGRRPSEPVGVVIAEPAALPRLTGIVVSGSARRALFVLPDPVARGEGERVGAFTVTSIRAGAVEMAGPDGPRTLYPAGDSELRAKLAAMRPLAALLGAEQRETSAETDQ